MSIHPEIVKNSLASATNSAGANTTHNSNNVSEDERNKVEKNADTKTNNEVEIHSIQQWQKILDTFKHRREEKTLHFLEIYKSFLAKENNQSFVITLLSKAIKANFSLAVQKIFSIVPLAAMEKAFTFKHMMLPMAYALSHHVNNQMIEILSKAGAKMKAEYVPGQDVTNEVIAHLSSSSPITRIYFATDGTYTDLNLNHEPVDNNHLHVFASHSNGDAATHSSLCASNSFTPAFVQHRISPLTIASDNVSTDLHADPYDVSSQTGFLSPFHGSDLERLQRQHTQNAQATPTAQTPQTAGSSHSQTAGGNHFQTAGASHSTSTTNTAISSDSLTDGSLNIVIAGTADLDDIHPHHSGTLSEFYISDSSTFDTPLQGVTAFEMGFTSQNHDGVDTEETYRGFNFGRCFGQERFR